MHDEFSITLFLVAFLPGIVATARGHRSMLAIWLLNIVALGLIVSIVGAVFGLVLALIATVWALGGNTSDNRRRDSAAIGRAVSDALARERDAINREQWIKTSTEDTITLASRRK